MSNLKNLWNEMVNQFHGPFSILVYKLKFIWFHKCFVLDLFLNFILCRCKLFFVRIKTQPKLILSFSPLLPIYIELKRQILVFSIGIFIIFVTCLVFISRTFHQNQKEDTDKWIGELEPKNPMNQPDHFEIQHPKSPFLQNQRVLATSDVYKRILTDFNETDHSKPRALP